MSADNIKLIYIAGPYTAQPYDAPDAAWQIEQNIRRAEYVAKSVMKHSPNVWPTIPHSNTRGYFVGLCSGEHAYDGTMAMLRRCDAAVFIPGWLKSPGSIGEWEDCNQKGTPKFELPSLIISAHYTSNLHNFLDAVVAGKAQKYAKASPIPPTV